MASDDQCLSVYTMMVDINRSLVIGDFEQVDRMLLTEPDEQESTIHSIGIFRITFSARTKLKNWTVFRDKLVANFRAMDEPVERLMKGLL